MKNILFLISIFFLGINMIAQDELDSLLSVWNNETISDSNRYDALYSYIRKGYFKSQPDSAIIIAEKGKEYAKTKKDSVQLARFMKVEAMVLLNKGEFDKALQINNEILEIQQRYKVSEAIESTYERIGKIYFYKSEFDKALEYGLRKLAFEEKRNNPEELAMSYNNVGAIYKALEEYEKALNYYLKTLDVYSELNDNSGMSTAYSNIATIYAAQKDNVRSIQFNKKSLKIREELGDKYTMIISYFNIALNYKALDTISEFSTDSLSEINQVFTNSKNNRRYNQEQALLYFTKAATTSKELKNDFLTAVCYLGLGELQYAQRDFKNAAFNIQNGLEGVTKVGNKGYMSEAYNLLYQVYKDSGEDKKALEMYENYIELTDSISSEENLKGILEQEYKYNYEKQAAIDSIKHNEAQKLKEIELKKQRAELKNQSYRQYLLGGGLFIIVLFSIYFIRKNKQVREQKQEVEKQKEFADQQRREADRQRLIAEEQKEVLKYQHREIRDSINYAQNLQKAVLPSREDVSKNFSESFILFKPKDVVSGDFYWTYQKGDLVYLAVVDCTGHGVPGAFMTIVANNLLNEIIQGVASTPKEIIEELHYRIKLRVGGSPTAQVRDSMDLGLFSYHAATKEVRFVGTHTSICRVRNSKLEKFKGSKVDIGYKPEIAIEEQVFNVEPNDMLYMHSDGYPDQKGGPKGKKFYYQPIRNKLVEISLLNLMEQEQIMGKTFEDWKGDLEQFDDVCMIGIRII